MKFTFLILAMILMVSSCGIPEGSVTTSIDSLATDSTLITIPAVTVTDSIAIADTLK